MDSPSKPVDFLPTIASKWTLSGSVFLATLLYALPDSVLSDMRLSATTTLWLVKLLASLALLLIGSYITLLLVVRYHRSRPTLDLADALREAKQRTSKEPELGFLPDLGIWQDEKTQLYYCPKCKKNPLANVDSGWYCTPCHWLVKSPEFKKKKAEEQRHEDEMVRRHNEERRI